MIFSLHYLIRVKGDFALIDFESVVIGEVLERLRRSKRLTQKDVADRTNLTEVAISNLERDLSKPTFETLISLAYGLDMHPAQLMYEIVESTNLHGYFSPLDEKDEQ